MNACLADALIYVGDQGHSIKRQIRKDVEQALVDVMDRFPCGEPVDTQCLPKIKR